MKIPENLKRTEGPMAKEKNMTISPELLLFLLDHWQLVQLPGSPATWLFSGGTD